jgi:hypothetical protein
MAKPNVAENSRFFDEHLLYEIQMFRFAYAALVSGSPAQAMANALIECFLLHSRHLIDFFKRKNDFDPRTFTTDFELNKRFVGDSALTRINGYVSHLSLARTKADASKIGAEERQEIFEAIERELVRFTAALRPEFKAQWGPTPKFMSAEIDVQKPAPSATNVIVSVTGPLAAAKLVESDPAFAAAATVSEWSDAQAVDLLSRR